MSHTRIPTIIILMLLLAACGNGGGSGSSNDSSGALQVETGMQSLSDEDYNALSEEDKLGVSNKVMGALFKGVGPDEFFDLGAGVSALAVQTDENYVSKIEKDLSKPINESQIRNLITQKYEFDDKQEPIQ